MIHHRMFFGGNLLRQPVFVQLRKDRPNVFHVPAEEAARAGQLLANGSSLLGSETTNNQQPATERAPSALPGADAIMHEAIFLGTYPGLTAEMLAYEVQVIRDFVKAKCT